LKGHGFSRAAKCPERVSKTGFVSGHGFSRAAKGAKTAGFSPSGIAANARKDIFETSSNKTWGFSP
jgi:hypothetical protein